MASPARADSSGRVRDRGRESTTKSLERRNVLRRPAAVKLASEPGRALFAVAVHRLPECLEVSRLPRLPVVHRRSRQQGYSDWTTGARESAPGKNGGESDGGADRHGGGDRGAGTEDPMPATQPGHAPLPPAETVKPPPFGVSGKRHERSPLGRPGPRGVHGPGCTPRASPPRQAGFSDRLGSLICHRHGIRMAEKSPGFTVLWFPALTGLSVVFSPRRGGCDAVVFCEARRRFGSRRRGAVLVRDFSCAGIARPARDRADPVLSLIHISAPTRPY